MLKRLFILICILCAVNMIANAGGGWGSGDEGFKAIDGKTYHVGDTLNIGTGSMPDGDFKFIRRAATSMFNYSSTTGYQGLANQANAFSRNYSNLHFKIIRIDKRGTKKMGYVYYPIISSGIVRFEVDLDNALKYGEVQGYDRPATASAIAPISKADELKKFKELLDAGVITQQEFDEQKQKLLK